MTAALDFILLVEVRSPAALEAVMGAAVTARALAELFGRLPQALQPVLAGGHDWRPVPSRRRGRWCQGFRCAGSSAAEDVEAITMAVRRLLFDLTAEVFGAATGAWAHVGAEVLPWPAHVVDTDGWLDARDGDAVATPEGLAGLHQQVQDLVVGDGLRTFLQPIVAFADGRVVGHEALTRGPAGHALESAGHLFDAAARTGLSVAVERAAALRAVDWAERLPAGAWLSLNTSVPLLMQADFRRAVARPGVVVEITEHLPIEQAPDLLPALAELRAGGARIALDDTGCGFADAAAAAILRPDIVKLCITVIRGVSRDPAILPELCRTIASFRELGAQILAEGVETAEQADILRPLGIELAQGWLFGRAAPAAVALAG